MRWGQFEHYSLAPGAAIIGNTKNLAAASEGQRGSGELRSFIEGEIVYTPTHQVIHNYGSYNLDLNNDGTPDFQLIIKTLPTTSTDSWLSRAEKAIWFWGISRRARILLSSRLLLCEQGR